LISFLVTDQSGGYRIDIRIGGGRRGELESPTRRGGKLYLPLSEQRGMVLTVVRVYRKEEEGQEQKILPFVVYKEKNRQVPLEIRGSG